MMEMTLLVLFMVFGVIIVAVIALVIVAQNDEVSKEGMSTLRLVARDMFSALTRQNEQKEQPSTDETGE